MLCHPCASLLLASIIARCTDVQIRSLGGCYFGRCSTDAHNLYLVAMSKLTAKWQSQFGFVTFVKALSHIVSDRFPTEIDGLLCLVANFAVKVTKQGCLSLCHFVTDSAWHWSNKGGSLHFWCITPNLTSFCCQSPVKSCKKRSLWMYFPDLLCPTR